MMGIANGPRLTMGFLTSQHLLLVFTFAFTSQAPSPISSLMRSSRSFIPRRKKPTETTRITDVHSPVTRVGTTGGRTPAKIIRAPSKITGLIMFHLGCQIKILVFWGIFGIKKSKKTKWQPCVRLSHTHSYPACHAPDRLALSLFYGKHRCSDMARV